MPAIQVFTTTDDRDEAQTLARALVERRVAACVQVIGPIQSTYMWEGEIQVAEEWLCLIKALDEQYPDLEAAIKEIHSYDVPEILAVPVIAGNEAYLSWLRQSCD